MYGLNRYVCDVLRELRDIIKLCEVTKRQENLLLSLVEEAQVMVNRMEAKLADSKDVELLHEEITKAKEELKELKQEVKEAKPKSAGGDEDSRYAVRRIQDLY